AGALVGELNRRPDRDVGAASAERRDWRRHAAHDRHNARPGRDVAKVTRHDQGYAVVAWPRVDVAGALCRAGAAIAKVPVPRGDIANALVREADLDAARHRAGYLEGEDRLDFVTGRQYDHLTGRSSGAAGAAHLQ